MTQRADSHSAGIGIKLHYCYNHDEQRFLAVDCLHASILMMHFVQMIWSCLKAVFLTGSERCWATILGYLGYSIVTFIIRYYVLALVIIVQTIRQ